MGSWVHLFSKFTPEALLFEALAICLLVAAYAAFWVLRKRRFGSVDTVVPAGLIKTYLNELILDAEQLRAQLFGLLASAGMQPTDAAKLAGMLSAQRTSAMLPSGNGPAITPTIQADPEMVTKLAVLEAKMLDQSKAMETLLMEKNRLASELQSAKSQASPSNGQSAKDSAGAGASESSGVVTSLQEKIQLLESKLEEYSVIEDDLANLKRLQQENAQLRAQLGGASAVASTPATAPVPDREQKIDSIAPAMAAAEVDALAEMLDAAPDPAETAAPAVAADQPNFDQLVNEVEKSLEPAAATAPQAPDPVGSGDPVLEEIPSPAASSAAAETKSDADLVAEFEKMLNG